MAYSKAAIHGYERAGLGWRASVESPSIRGAHGRERKPAFSRQHCGLEITRVPEDADLMEAGGIEARGHLMSIDVLGFRSLEEAVNLGDLGAAPALQKIAGESGSEQGSVIPEFRLP